MNDAWIIGVPLAGAAGAAAATAALIPWLRRRAILDHPNERASHTVPTPKGGGLAVVPVLLALFAVLYLAFPAMPPALPVVTLAAAALWLLSWWDDLHDLSPFGRLAGHFVAVAAGLVALPAEHTVFQGLLPVALDRVAAALTWVWFVNLFNFMDGIDGICGAETASIGAGLAAVAAVSGAFGPSSLLALAVAGCAVGFLVFNWHPAKIFMGDVGSIPLGFVLGWLLLDLAASGQWAAALILPAYYLADATITLVRRALRREKVWRAHKEHFYQRAHQRGLGHDAVVRRIAAANLGLIGLAAWAAAGHAWPALAGAAVVVALLLPRLAGWAGNTAGTAR